MNCMEIIKETSPINLPSWLYVLTLILPSFNLCSGHGRMIEPPSRASMFRYGFENPPNYDDNQLYCGGIERQYKKNNGKCGICGDPYDGEREHEAGGKYANGIIVRTYQVGQSIPVKIEYTANHKGWCQFKICPNNNISKPASQSCLNKYPLFSVDHPGVLQIPVVDTAVLVEYRLTLPTDLLCSQCVLQWRYHAGNSWGRDPTGFECIGCGEQEEFYACADVAIIDSSQRQMDRQQSAGRETPKYTNTAVTTAEHKVATNRPTSVTVLHNRNDDRNRIRNTIPTATVASNKQWWLAASSTASIRRVQYTLQYQTFPDTLESGNTQNTESTTYTLSTGGKTNVSSVFIYNWYLMGGTLVISLLSH